MSSGKGRGALFRQILGQSSSSSDDAASTSTGKPSQPQDSGLGVSPSHSPSMGPRSTGRGRILEQISSSSSSSAPKSGGRGRALLIQTVLSSKSSSSADEGTSGTSLPAPKIVPSIRGRGQIPFLAAPDPPQIAAQPAVEEVAKSLEATSIRKEESDEEREPVIKRGTKGHPVPAVCNYIRLQSERNKGVFEYEVRFDPNIDSRNMRFKYLNEHRQELGGTKTFDGTVLYLPILLPETVTILHSKNPVDNSDVTLKIIYKRKKPLKDCIHLYNVLFQRIMGILNYVRFDRKQYDPTAPKIIPQHKLEVWPGYVMAVDEYEGGLMLCCDVSHRLLCQTTVLELLHEIYHANPSQFQENAKKSLLGSVVLTRYNNKTYRIDDINFNDNPQATFMTSKGEVSYVDYYRTQYNITIKDKAQPLLINISQRRVANKDTPEELMFCLIPEICYLTGLRDEQRADFRIMRDIATFTRVTPNQRVAALNKFYSNVNSNIEAREVLSQWGLSLASGPETLQGRQFEEEKVIFARKEFGVGPKADFSKYIGNNEVLEVVNMTNWVLIHTRRDSKQANAFLDCAERNSRPMGIQISRPKVRVLDNDRTDAYVNALREMIQPSTQLVVTICPTSRDDRYAAIKKICCAEIPVASQVINSKTLSNEAKLRAIVQKIILQMNCKLGGTLWSVKIPFQRVMICGVDSYHEANQKGNSVAAFVASLNNSYTKWYSKAVVQTKKEEIVNGLCSSLKFALQAYKKVNNCLPERIVIFRDGVGDGQLKLCAEYEVPQFEAACRYEQPDYNPTMTFIVVQKRINTRIFAGQVGRGELQNPDPGFVLDHTVTRRYLYDFFLISQSVRQGTVSPTHFVVVKDSANFSPDILQRLSYKLCFLYYNWPGTVRVPACCQYAHKLAYLVGQSVKRQPSEKLADKLFYL